MRIVAETAGQDWLDRYAYLQCPECLKPTCALLRCVDKDGASQEWEDTQDGERVENFVFPKEGTPTRKGWELKQSWPDPPQPRVPEHLPPPVHKAFAGAEGTFGVRSLEEQTAAGYGRALDIGTKLIAAQEPDASRYERKMIAQRLDMLADAHRIPPDLRDWARHIQAIRNPAMHDVQDMPRSELEALRALTEMVLRYLFTLPTMVAERKAATKAGLTDPPPAAKLDDGAG